MRIAIEEPLHGGGKGGVSIYYRNLIRELRALAPDDEFRLFTWFYGDYARRAEAFTIASGGPTLLPRWPETVIRHLEWTMGLPVIGKYLENHDIDLLHSFRVPRRKLLPTVATVPDLFPIVHPEWTTPYLIDQWENIIRPGMERVDRVIAISEHTKRDLVERWAVPASKIEVILWGVDRTVFGPQDPGRAEAVRRERKLPERFFVMVGPFDPWCDPANSLRALAALPATCADVALVMAGHRGSLGDATDKLAAELGITSRVRWTGFVPQPDLAALYAGSQALVYPSFYEGFGLPVLEAMGCGAPVITSTVTSLPEVAGDAGLLVDPADIEALSDAMQRVLEDSTLRESLRRKGLERAARFTWAETARRHLDVYRGVI